MNIGIIGEGAIGSYVRNKIIERGHVLRALLLLPELVEETAAALPGTSCVANVDDLPEDIDLMIDCAGHAGLSSHGPAILQRGIDLTTVSIGALTDADLYRRLEDSATAGNARVHLVSGAVGALDALRAARAGDLQSVTYTGRNRRAPGKIRPRKIGWT